MMKYALKVCCLRLWSAFAGCLLPSVRVRADPELRKAFCGTRAGADGKEDKAASLFLELFWDLAENMQGNLGKGLCQDICIPIFVLCFAHLYLIFYHFGENFSGLTQSACTQFCFCGHLSLTGVDLLHSFFQALIFSPPACPLNLFPRGLSGTFQAWGDRIREMNTSVCASVTGGGKAAKQHVFIFLQNNEELSLWLSEFPFQLFWSFYLFFGQIQTEVEALKWGNGMCGAAGMLQAPSCDGAVISVIPRPVLSSFALSVVTAYCYYNT